MARATSNGPGWLTSLLGAAVLIAGGFAVGLVLGVISEEPDLVVEHLGGGSEEVQWGADPAGQGAAPDVAAPAREQRGPEPGDLVARRPAAPAAAIERPVVEPPAPRPAPAARASAPPSRSAPAVRPPERRPAAAVPAPEPARPRVARAARPTEGFSVQVGAFSRNASAESLAASLRDDGFDGYVTAGAGDGRWRVRVGPVASRAAADALARRLQSERDLPTWVVSESGS